MRDQCTNYDRKDQATGTYSLKTRATKIALTKLGFKVSDYRADLPIGKISEVRHP